MIDFEGHKTLFRPFFQDRMIYINVFLAFAINILIWITLFWQVEDFTALIPLHYNIYFGIDLLGPWYQIFVLPGVGLGIILVNLILGIFYFNREKILSYFLIGVGTIVQFLLLAATIAIILLNF